MKSKTIDIDGFLEVYHKALEICMSDGFVAEINQVRYTKEELSYDFLLDNATEIAYIESTTIPNSRLYTSNMIQFAIIMSMRRDTDKVEFIRTSDKIAIMIYKSLLWFTRSGYSTAIQDVKDMIAKMADADKSVDII